MFVSAIIYLYYSKLQLENVRYLFEIKHTEFFFILYIQLIYNTPKFLNNGNSFYSSNLIRLKLKVDLFCGLLFIVAMEISIIFKDT